MNWTIKDPNTGVVFIYPGDPQMGLKLYSAVCQAMAGYIKHRGFDTIHLHDYHVSLIPFYLGDEYLQGVPVHLTIHNATYQGIVPLIDGGYSSLDRINLSGEKLFHKYFDFVDHLNLMRACMLRMHETGGKITTVSGNIEGTWGYAAELKESPADLLARASLQKDSTPGGVFVPNGYLDLFEKLPVAGITNGMGDKNKPENMPELKAEVLREMQRKRGEHDPIFKNPTVQNQMLTSNHDFDTDRPDVKKELKRLLHLETFDSEPHEGTILMTVVGRLVEQKNLGLVADIVEPILNYHKDVNFVILASAPEDDPVGKHSEAKFSWLASRHPNRVYFNNTFNRPLSKLILASGDFSLIHSRFEPCGLVDYEAALVGNIPICRATGGLVKIRHCGYLYDWLDINDWDGEVNAFYWKIREAIDTYRDNHTHHDWMIREAMKIDASWDSSAKQYVEIYTYGLLVKKWHAERRELIAKFVQSLAPEDRASFTTFFMPAQQEYGDRFDWALKETLAL